MIEFYWVRYGKDNQRHKNYQTIISSHQQLSGTYQHWWSFNADDSTTSYVTEELIMVQL